MIEAGLPGLVLLLLFLAWWGMRASAIWRSPDAAELARAACIASAAILLHSLVDYPLRTSAIAAIMAMAVAMMADPAHRRHQARAEERRPTAPPDALGDARRNSLPSLSLCGGNGTRSINVA